MKYLVVSDVGDIGVKHLATALHKIDSLQVRKGFLTLNGFSYLVEACKRLESPVRTRHFWTVAQLCVLTK